MMKRKGAAKIGIMEIAIIGALILVLNSMGALDFITGAAEPTPDGIQTLDGWCAVEDVSVTLDGVEKYNYATAITGSIFYILNSDPIKAVADGTVVTMSPGDTLDAYFSLNGTNHYTTVVENVVIPCKGSYTIRGDIYANQTLSVTVWNSDGSVATVANNETMGIGDIETLEFKIQGKYETGAAEGYRVVCDYNSTGYDDVVLSLDVGYGTATSAAIPNQHAAPSALHNTKAWDLPGIISNEKLMGSIMIDASDSNDPTGVAANVINCTLYDYDYFLKDDGTVGLGVEDTDDWSDVGDTTAVGDVISIRVS